MVTARATICNKKGLHARAAAKVVKLANSFDVKMEVVRLSGANMDVAEARAGATSILSLLMLAAENKSTVEVTATGDQAQEAVDALLALIGRRFDEEE